MLILRLFVRLLFIMSMWKWLLPDISSALSMCVKMHITFEKFSRFFLFILFYARSFYPHFTCHFVFACETKRWANKNGWFPLGKNSEYPNIKEYFKSNFLRVICIMCTMHIPYTHLPLAYRNTQFASETGWDWAKR